MDRVLRGPQFLWVLTACLLALAAVSLVSIIRALLPARLLAQKPWSCDLCIGFWTTAALCGAWTVVAAIRDRVIGLDRLLVAFPAHGLVLLILARLRPPAFDLPKETPDE